MKPVILDTSAILAVINQEAGSEVVKPLLANSVVSSVNIAETSAILVSRYKIPLIEVKTVISQLIGNIINFNEEQAYVVAELEIVNKDKKYGLSLADKACIALAVSMDMPIYSRQSLGRAAV